MCRRSLAVEQQLADADAEVKVADAEVKVADAAKSNFVDAGSTIAQ